MSTDRDTTRVVRSWLEEGVTALPDRVLDAVLDQVPATPQRRPMWPPRRATPMSYPVRIVLAAAAVLIVAVVGWRFLPSASTGPGTPTIGPTSNPTQTAGPTSPPTLPVSGAVAPGTYLVTSYTETPFQITVPAGWTVTLGMLAKGDFYNERTAVLLRPWIVTHVYVDACQWRGSVRPVGPTKAELVAALTAQTGRNAEGPVGVTLGGLGAARFVLSVPTGFDVAACSDGYLRPWPDQGGNESVGPPMFEGSITTVYVVETGLKATAIQAARYEGSSAADVAELQAILDSIAFQP